MMEEALHDGGVCESRKTLREEDSAPQLNHSGKV